MIITLYSRNTDEAVGKINTTVSPPTATGVGVNLLESWIKSREGEPMDEIIDSLERFYSSWSTQEHESSVPSHELKPETIVAIPAGGGSAVLFKAGPDELFQRVDGDWKDVTDDYAARSQLTGQSVKVVEKDILADWDAGKVKSLRDAARYAKA